MILTFFSIFLFGSVAVSANDNLGGLQDVARQNANCSGTGWFLFGPDDRCIRLIKEKYTRDGALQYCQYESAPNLPPNSPPPQLLTINSPFEEDYLTTYLFESNGFEINVWLGMKRKLNATGDSEWRWDDGAPIEFADWDSGAPGQKFCAVIQSGFNPTVNGDMIFAQERKGRWVDENCNEEYFVVCERPHAHIHTPTIQELVILINQTSTNLTIIINEEDNRINLLEKQITVIQQNLIEINRQLNIAFERIERLERSNSTNNSSGFDIPIGFIYTQYPKDRAPDEIFPLAIKWEDVTQEYEGLFFRVEGGSAAEFGKIQEENSPRMIRFISGLEEDMPREYFGARRNVSIEMTGWSEAFFTGSSFQTKVQPFFIAFEHQPNEVLPRNTAIRIWRRVA